MSRTFILAEAGSTHDGDFLKAARLIEAARAPGQTDHPRLVAAMERVAGAAKRAGRRLVLPLGHPVYPRTVAECRDLGAGLLLCGAAPEVRLLRSLSSEVTELHRATGRS